MASLIFCKEKFTVVFKFILCYSKELGIANRKEEKS